MTTGQRYARVNDARASADVYAKYGNELDIADLDAELLHAQLCSEACGFGWGFWLFVCNALAVGLVPQKSPVRALTMQEWWRGYDSAEGLPDALFAEQ